MESVRFLVTGCGRSGSRYTANLLCSLGSPCGHESVFGERLLADSSVAPQWPESVRGESSWLAAPFFASLARGTVVLHQVREPVSVVRSFLRIRLFEGASGWKHFAERHVPAIGSGTAFERCVKYWLHWNTLAASAAQQRHLIYRRHRLEDLGPEFVEQLCAELGAPRTRAQIERALQSVPRDTNTSGSKRSDAAVRWSNLPRGDWTPELEEFAGRSGYSGENLDGTLRVLPMPRAALPFSRADSSSFVSG